ncbi:MAG: nucleoside deaminase [Candidatus Margulisiibacteriota bacterium]
MPLNIESIFNLFNHIRPKLSINDLLKTSTIDDVAALLQLKIGQPISDDYAMQLALFLAYSSILPNQNGGPFGAVVLNEGRLISYGANHVVRLNDPTEHGEVNAIRQAIGNHFSLNNAILITSCYPCPMCMGCAIDHNISQIHYCSTPEDAKMYGNFKDQTLNNVLKIVPDLGLVNQTKNDFKFSNSFCFF